MGLKEMNDAFDGRPQIFYYDETNKTHEIISLFPTNFYLQSWCRNHQYMKFYYKYQTFISYEIGNYKDVELLAKKRLRNKAIQREKKKKKKMLAYKRNYILIYNFNLSSVG